MTLHRVTARDGTALHVQETGAGAPVLLLNGLCLDHTVWDALLPHIRAEWRIIRFDARGQGQSDVPPPPYSMGSLVSDAEAVCDALSVKDAVAIGMSVGGMVAQGLAVKRPDLVRALVLSGTAVKLDTAQIWQDRIATARTGGMDAVADDLVARWFAPGFEGRDLWRNRIAGTPLDGYLGTCAAIAGTDLLTPTSGLRLPTLALAGAQDRAVPADMVRDLAQLVPGCRIAVLRGAGHLPPLDAALAMATEINDFLTAIAH